MIDRIRYGIIAIGIVCVGALAGAPNASAASPYDNVIQPMPELKIKSPDGTKELDLTGKIMTELRVTSACNQGNHDGFLALFEHDDAHWVIGKTVHGVQYPGGIAYMQITTRPSPYLVLTGAPGYPHLNGSGAFSSNSGYFAIWLENDGTTFVQCSATSEYLTDIAYGNMEVDSNWAQPWLVTMPINYPPEYEGEIVPESWSPPEDKVPNWYVSGAIDWKVSIHDMNFNTFDGIAWTCSEDGDNILSDGSGLAPVLHYEIWDADNLTMHISNVQSATAPIEWQAPSLDTDQEYQIVGWYDCGGSVNFADQGRKHFTITKFGSLETTMFNDCLTSDFPFVDVEPCIENIYVLMNLLSFNTIQFTNVYTVDTCYTLSTLHTWIGVSGSNRVLCAKFSPSVRNTVTPFVTFALGLLMIGFLAGRGQHGTRSEKV